MPLPLYNMTLSSIFGGVRQSLDVGNYVLPLANLASDERGQR